MYDYLGILIFIASGAIGAIVGAVCVFNILQAHENMAENAKLRRMKKYQTKKRKFAEELEKRQEDIDIEPAKKKGKISFLKKNSDKDKKEQKSNLLKKRLTDKSNSWTVFNCEIDAVDTKGYINKSRRREDSAYQYIKSKKNSKEQ